MYSKNIKFIIIVACLLAFLVFTRASQTYNQYILLEFKYDKENFSLINKSLEQGNYPSPGIEKDYQINLISKEKNILYSSSFDPSLLYSDGGNESLEGGALILEQAVFYVSLPNFEEVRNVEIVKDNKTIFEEAIYDVGATNCRIK